MPAFQEVQQAADYWAIQGSAPSALGNTEWQALLQADPASLIPGFPSRQDAWYRAECRGVDGTATGC